MRLYTKSGNESGATATTAESGGDGATRAETNGEKSERVWADNE